MKIRICLFLLSIFCVLTLSGCHAALGAGDTQKDLQRLQQAEIYSADGNLLRTITDEDILKQFNQIHWADLSSSTQADGMGTEDKSLSVQCTIILYKTPAALLHDESLEKYLELTVYEKSNIIKEQIAPENVKAIPVSEELLTFYVTVSDEEKELLLSLAEV